MLAPAWGEGGGLISHRLLLTPFPPREGRAGAPGSRELDFRLCGQFSLERRGLHPWVRDVQDEAMASPEGVSAKVKEERDQLRETVGRG